MEQRTEEWRNARRGLITASRAAEIMTSGKANELFGGMAYSYAIELILDRIGIEREEYQSPAMEWGIEWEPEARRIYHENVAHVHEVGFIIHPEYDFIGCSPDGMVGDEGLIEIKCPQEKQHLINLLSDSLPKQYFPQIQFQLMVTGRKWCDFISFHPYFRPELMFKKIRVLRNEEYISNLLQRSISLNDYIEQQIKILGI